MAVSNGVPNGSTDRAAPHVLIAGAGWLSQGTIAELLLTTKQVRLDCSSLKD